MVRLVKKGNEALGRRTLATKDNRRKIDMAKY